MKYALRTVLAVPVVCGETLVGVLVVVNKRSGGVFTGDDDRLLTLLAEHAAVAVEHAGLIETVRDINTRLGQSATEPGREPGATSAQLNAVLQSINEGIAILGTDFRVQWMNQTMQRWFGECGETGQRTCYKAFCGRDTPCEDFCPCLRALKSGKTEQVKEAVRLLKGVPRSCELTASPIKNEREEVVQIVVAVRDITEHKESELARVHEAELQTLSALVTSVNHEINNPLTAILGNALLLQQQLTGNNGRVAERLNIIADSARRISEVTHKLSGVVLPVSCKYAGNMRMLDLEASTRRNHDA